MKVGGRDFSQSKLDVEQAMRGETADTIQKYVVEVNGTVYPPKQVLARATGWDRQSFTTMEAQRVLSKLGFVCREAGTLSDGRPAWIQTAAMSYEVDWMEHLVKMGVQVLEENGVTAYSYAKRWFYDACVVVAPQGNEFVVALHPGLPPGARSEVCGQAKELIENFQLNGPDGTWQERSDGGHQVWLTQRYFNDDGVEEVPPSARGDENELWHKPL